MNKKPLIIIPCYLNTDMKISILNENIKTLSDKFDIMVVSHYHIPTYIQDKVRYCIYDSDNEVIIYEDNAHNVWYAYNNMHLNIFVKDTVNISFAVYLLMLRGIGLANLIGYSDVFFIEGDLQVHSSDVDRILSLKDISDNNNTLFTFFESYDDMYADCQLFYVNTDFFIRNMPKIYDIYSFNLLCDKSGISKYNLESIIYKYLYIMNIDRCSNLKQHPKTYLTNSIFNLSYSNNSSYMSVYTCVDDEIISFDILVVCELHSRVPYLVVIPKDGIVLTGRLKMYNNDVFQFESDNLTHYFSSYKFNNFYDINEVKIEYNGTLVATFTFNGNDVLNNTLSYLTI